MAMEELTLILFVASLVSGGAVMLMRKLGAGAYLMSLTMSVLSLGAVVSDESLMASEGAEPTLAIIAPFIVFLYSLWGMLFGYKEGERWRRRRLRTCSRRTAMTIST